VIDPEIAAKDATARSMVAEWIHLERTLYADRKYEPGGENYVARLNDLKEKGLDSTEIVFLTNYLKRAEMLGIDTPQGRQAFGKFVVTAIAIMERIVLAHGDMPKPGLTTGEIEEWT
jgi:hypothetical protein